MRAYASTRKSLFWSDMLCFVKSDVSPSAVEGSFVKQETFEEFSAALERTRCDSSNVKRTLQKKEFSVEKKLLSNRFSLNRNSYFSEVKKRA